ncbi:ethanolaminephosphotransferase [Malassezia vespertilionis]|uniref:Ept1p n=1 Tax=Malassezia vespertilionis TaxID=2020962 RepID=A0A2N1JDH5_9BASI|nr:ethanolaminephosphotransferase [Malassezia vespertilionis]PKI84593.1 hypothetical protein MVES_001593 [Malassezia vespertilionis]WFD06347.1 ethanolaminephosphotransferase [Malassezia vespertilionis]
MGYYIGEDVRANIHTYKYAGEDHSFVSKYILGPYWNWLVTLFPLSVAPNTITLLGLVLILLNFVSLLALDWKLDNSTSLRVGVLDNFEVPLPVVSMMPNKGLPSGLDGTPGTMHAVIPPALLVVWAFSLFMYQSLDSIDGKQARRTRMAGPLGELFDHGCDALNTTLGTFLVASATGLGRSYWTICALVSAMANFYLTTWEEFHTHILFLSWFSGPVEGILLICSIYLMAAAFGGPAFCLSGIWNATGLVNVSFVREYLAWMNWPISDVLMAFGFAGLLANAFGAYGNVYASCKRKGTSVSEPLLGLVPFVFQCVSNIAWMLGNGQRVFVQGSLFIPFLCFWGLSFAYLVGLLILSHVAKTRFPFANWLFIPSLIGAVDAWLPQPLLQTSPAAAQGVVYGALAMSVLVYGHFVYDVITAITKETGRPCFRVVRSKDGN